MPGVIELTALIVSSVATSVVGANLLYLGTYALAYTGLAFGAQALQGMFVQKPSVPKPEDGSYNLKQPVPPLTFALGRVKKGSDYAALEESAGVAYHVLIMEDVRLPAGARSVDKVFLFSVLTHMYQNEVRHYLNEFSRILAPGGMVFATCFLVDEVILAKARETNLTQWDLRFEHEIETGCFINNPDRPRGATAFTKNAIEAANASSDLNIVNYLNGTWSGYHEHCDDGQDVIILQKPE